MPLLFFYNSHTGFIVAVDNWSKVLCKLLVKLPTYKERALILENLYDEHGSGSVTKSHTNTFNNFLKDINSEHKIDYSSNIYVDTFNTSLDNILQNKSWVYCTAVIGMIEYTYINSSKNINKYVNKYVNKYQKVNHHYSLHETMDCKHSEDLFSLIGPIYNKNKQEIEDGLQCG